MNIYLAISLAILLASCSIQEAPSATAAAALTPTPLAVATAPTVTYKRAVVNDHGMTTVDCIKEDNNYPYAIKVPDSWCQQNPVQAKNVATPTPIPTPNTAADTETANPANPENTDVDNEVVIVDEEEDVADR